jgi:putative two-component system response regulator
MSVAMTSRVAQARVLVVDDDPGNRMLCAANLRHAGMKVLEADNGLRGFECALLDAPDLIVLDVMMPGLDGFELAELLRAEESTCRIPFLFLSAETEAANRRRAQAVGALAYMTKPFDPAAMVALVLGALSGGGTTLPKGPQSHKEKR